ncbi:hypothetical protein [uncultured Cellulomonas sp.]|uniref:hypothetical protein n=1 Tax=uncultured Cellulomonas sp. TaxID=189682 RepID=UPI0028E74219|nr:hypothetical protein [uncultured Cellulomonas sp.]
MTETWTTGRLVLLGAGIVLVGVGVVVGLTSVPQGQWPSVLFWLAGGVAVHDAVLAPAAVVLGTLVLPRVPVGWRPALRAGALGAVVLAIFAVVIVVAAGMRRDPSVVPVPLTTSLVVATSALVLAVLTGVAVGTAWGRPRGRGPADPDLLPPEDAD